jgi:hypothetical protein
MKELNQHLRAEGKRNATRVLKVALLVMAAMTLTSCGPAFFLGTTALAASNASDSSTTYPTTQLLNL